MPLMTLKVLLPFEIFAQETDVARIVVETPQGSFGLLPQRLDCVAALVPGILSLETAAQGEVFLALDEGVLVKTGAAVVVSARRALRGGDLSRLRTAIQAVSPAAPALLRSAFELPAPQTEAIQAALYDWFGDPVALKFEVAPELVGGIELRAQGQKLAWSISDYLGELSTDLEKSLRVQEPA